MSKYLQYDFNLDFYKSIYVLRYTFFNTLEPSISKEFLFQNILRLKYHLSRNVITQDTFSTKNNIDQRIFSIIDCVLEISFTTFDSDYLEIITPLFHERESNYN
jgi:hypothetical protein